MEEEKNEQNKQQDNKQNKEHESVGGAAVNERPQEPETGQAKGEKPEEFSVKWHLKALAVIYGALGIFYIILRLTI